MKKAKKLYVIKRELTLENEPTTPYNSYWCGVERGWGSLLNALTLSKSLMARVKNVHHSTRWYTKREHAHLEESPIDART